MSTPINPEDFLSRTSSSRGIQRLRTATWNYVATVRKATAVTHSCVGCFTGPNDSNLIICKGSLVEIYLITENELKLILDFPVVEKVVFMELHHQLPASADYLFIATQLYKFCVHRWDADSSKLITIGTMRYPLRPHLAEGQWNYCQGGTICRRPSNYYTIVLYSSQVRITVIRTVDFQEFESVTGSVVNTIILDMKFLYGHGPPTVVVLGKQLVGGRFRLKVLEFSGTAFNQIAWQHLPNFIVKSTLLIPVHKDPYGFLIMGREAFSYVQETGLKTKHMGSFNIKAYGRVHTYTKKHSYLLGDHDGRLLMIELPEFTLRLLGRTSIPSSISYIGGTVVFVGSRSTDSQLVKIHDLGDLEVLNRYTNSGPISDFCVINKPGGRRKILLCGGTHEKSFLEVFSSGTGIIVESSKKTPQIIKMWSLRSSAFEANHTYLILQTLDLVVIVYALVDNAFIDRSDMMNGFKSGVTTVYCQLCSHRQFAQVTEECVRLINSKTGVLRHSWNPGSPIFCASATNKQILLAMGKHLVYLEVGDRQLTELKRVQLDSDISCLDISPLGGENRYSSKLAAVGGWTENKVQIYSLPDLTILSEERLSCIPRCVLLCAFGEEWYLLCSAADGILYTFKLDKENSQLHDKNFVSVGPTSKTLRKISSNGEVCVFLSTDDVPTVICYKNNKLAYKAVNQAYVADSCPFRCENFPDGLIIATLDGFVFCKLGDFAESGRIQIQSYGRRICRQEETQSYAIITEEKQQMKRNLILLLDENLNTSSAHELEEHEVGLSIVSCRFTNDDRTFYCVGTSFENNPTEGRILLFRVRDGKLVSTTEYDAGGAVHYLKNLEGGLLVDVSHNSIRFMEWRENELHENPASAVLRGAEARFCRLCSLSQEVKYDLQDIVIAPENQSKQTAFQMVENEVMFSSNARYHLRSYSRGMSTTVVGQWYSGEFITQIKAGTLSRLSDDDYAQVPSVLFSTTTGAIGVIVSLPCEVYKYLEELEQKMRLERKSDVLTRKCIGLRDNQARHFIDGDFLESFMTLTAEEQMSIATKIKIDVKVLKGILGYLALCHRRLDDSDF